MPAQMQKGTEMHHEGRKGKVLGQTGEMRECVKSTGLFQGGFQLAGWGLQDSGGTHPQQWGVGDRGVYGKLSCHSVQTREGSARLRQLSLRRQSCRKQFPKPQLPWGQDLLGPLLWSWTPSVLMKEATTHPGRDPTKHSWTGMSWGKNWLVVDTHPVDAKTLMG